MAATAELVIEQPSKDTLVVILSGSWKLDRFLPAADGAPIVESYGNIGGAAAGKHESVSTGPGFKAWSSESSRSTSRIGNRGSRLR